MANTFYLSFNEYISQLLPHGLLELPALLDLKGTWMEPMNVQIDPSISARSALLLDQPLVLGIPGLGGTQLIIGNEGVPSIFMFTLDTVPSPLMRLIDTPLALRFSSDLLRPARHPIGSSQRVELDPTRSYLEIRRDSVTLSLDFDGNLGLAMPGGLDLPLCLIGDTGVAVEASSVTFYGDRGAPPPGQPAGWRGLGIGSARLYLPGDLGSALGTLEVHNAFIGNGGFSGSVSDNFAPAKKAKLFGCLVELSRVELTFIQNSLAASSLTGRLKIPYFDEWVAVDISLGLDGNFHIRLAQGLPTLRKPDLLELRLDSLRFGRQKDRLSLVLSGQLTPLIANLRWPTFDLRELSIDSEGNVLAPTH